MNIYGQISKFFIENKKLSLLLIIGIILWGVVSFVLMPKQYNPDIVAPAFLIDVNFPGATVDEVYQIITKPLEDVLNEIPGIENIYSQSRQGGRATVIVEFYVGQDLEKSMISLRQRISSRMDLSPLGVGMPYIASIDPEDLPIKTLALHSKRLDAIHLRKTAYRLREELKQVEGTSLIDVIGGRKREFQILLDPQRMQASQTSLREINRALDNTSLLQTLGFIKAKNDYFLIETQEQAHTTEDIESIIIASNYEKNLTIRDVARVIEGPQEAEDFVRFYRKDLHDNEAVFVAISKLKGRNIVQVSRRIDEKLDELKARRSYLKDVDIDVVKDEGRVANEEISGLLINLIEAISIVFLVLFSFLNHRAAFIVAFSIPTTLLTVLALGNAFGYTINRITLFALILSLGLLVDSATVVIENIVKNKKKHPQIPKENLIPMSVSEVGAGLFLSTLTTVLAFVPMAFVTGMMGPYMGPLPFFVSAALVVALVFAYSLNPWLAALFCKDKIDSEITERCGVICQMSTKLLEKYKNTLSLLLKDQKKRRTFLTAAFVLLLVVLTFPVIKLVRFRMLPKADREQVYVYIDLDRGTSVERSQKVARQISKALLSREPHIRSIQSFVGIPPVLDFNGLFRGVQERKGSHQITLKLNLTHPDKRKIPSEELAYQCRNFFLQKLKPYPDAVLQVVEDPPGPPVKATFQLKIKSLDAPLLYAAARDIEQKVRSIEELKDVDISALEPQDKFVLSVDKEAAARARVSVESISTELEAIFGHRLVGVYHSDYNYEQEYIVLKFGRDLRDQIDDLDRIYVPNELGNHVPVSRFIKVVRQPQEDVIRGDNREQVIYVSGEMGRRSVTYAVIDLLGQLKKYQLSGHQVKLVRSGLLSFEYLVDGEHKLKVEIGGEWDLTMKVFRDLGLAMMVAIVLIYLVLVAQFNSFLIPFLIMGTIPLALIGIMPGFALLFILGRVYFSATSMIGFIALAGIVVNNAIIFIEYTMQAAREHSSLEETLLDAGVTRARPILLTSITTVFGSLVIAADPVWSGLAWAIVFGLSLSALLTLVVFPLLMVEFLGEKWFGFIIGKDVNR